MNPSHACLFVFVPACLHVGRFASLVVVSPDAGGVYRAKKFREGLAYRYGLDAGLAMIIKQRAKANEVHSCTRAPRYICLFFVTFFVGACVWSTDSYPFLTEHD